MPSTTKEKKASKKYYETHKDYKEKKIKKQIAKQKNNKDKTNKYHRDYYADNENYRVYKRKYSKQYHRAEPVKSRSRKERKALKEK